MDTINPLCTKELRMKEKAKHRMMKHSIIRFYKAYGVTQPTFPEFIPYLYEINAIYFLYIINIFILKHTPFFTEKKYQSPNLHPLYIFTIFARSTE